MKQFLYLDTDIVNSIIAQEEKGLITQKSVENETGSRKESEHTESLSGNASGSGSFLKIVQAQAELEGDVSMTHTKGHSSSTKDVMEKILHDAGFDIAYTYIKPAKVKRGCQDYDEEGNYIEMKRTYSFVDFKYLQDLFCEKGIIEYIKKNSAEQIEASAEHAREGHNREELRKAGVNFKQEVKKAIQTSNKQFDEIEAIIRALRSFIPYDRLLISHDGYLIPLDEKYFRVDPTNLGFRYGGEITCVGMITNIIGEDCNPNDPKDIFATIQHAANEVLRSLLPTTESNLCVIHPIAVYYGE